MVAQTGRNVRILRGVTAVAGARADNITINNEPIDITDKGDAGWRTLLADVGVRSIDADIAGVIIDSTFLALAVGAGSSLLETYSLEVNGIGDFDGSFFLSNLSISGEQEDAATFTANIVSSGTIVFTADV